ncbi:MAG: trypsin-like peptidase domain-containing protein [Lachnospiraceae bacterium]|nr:trypsin-like peptidase domain-containing protein [Lachnospiraceae bacterium]
MDGNFNRDNNYNNINAGQGGYAPGQNPYYQQRQIIGGQVNPQPQGQRADGQNRAYQSGFYSSQAATTGNINQPIGSNAAQNMNAYATQPKKEKKASGGTKFLVALCVGLCFGITAALGFFAVNKLTENYVGTSTVTNADYDALQKEIDQLKLDMGNQNSNTTGTTVVNNQTVSTIVTDVTEVVDKVMPSMVSITNLYTQTYNYWGRTYTEEYEASGSGFIVGEKDSEYIVVTNYHVIENNVQLTAQFVDESKAAAYVKGYDQSIDIAVLGVLKSNLTPETMNAIKVAELGDSDALKIGEPAIAIGNALGYGQSVTTGVISALNRDINMENTWNSLIQTNAAINPGNSGGALLNIQGQVIGINSNKLGGTTIEGMGYAIPISDVRETIETFMNREQTTKVDSDNRGYMGIKGATVDANTVQAYGIPEGIYITSVYQRSAAEAAGLIKGDVITKVEGQTVKEIAQLQEILEYYKSGDTITVTIMRAGADGYTEMDVEVTLTSKEG